MTTHRLIGWDDDESCFEFEVDVIIELAFNFLLVCRRQKIKNKTKTKVCLLVCLFVPFHSSSSSSPSFLLRTKSHKRAKKQKKHANVQANVGK